MTFLSSAFTVSVLVFVCVFGATLLAMRLRTALPHHHLARGAETAIKLAAGLVGTMSALVIGLLLASAQTQYYADSNLTTQMAATSVLVDHMLSGFGDEALPVRAELRHNVEAMRSGIWPDSSMPVELVPATVDGTELYGLIESLDPKTDVQRSLKPQILQKAVALGQLRWQLAEQANTDVSAPLLVVVVCWLAVIFFSYGLFAPANATVVVMLLFAALSVSDAIFLILELDTPYGGLIQISSKPMDSALEHLGK